MLFFQDIFSLHLDGNIAFKIMDFNTTKVLSGFILWTCFFPVFSQTVLDQAKGLNDLELGQNLSTLKDQLQMITGTETVYQNNPWLAESVKRNLKNGIREGINTGETKRILNGNRASDHRILFFKEGVFKIRWTFNNSDFPDLKPVLADFVAYFTNKFGPPTDTILDDTFIWNGHVNRLQVFFDGRSIQVEFRDEQVEKTIKTLTP